MDNPKDICCKGSFVCANPDRWFRSSSLCLACLVHAPHFCPRDTVCRGSELEYVEGDINTCLRAQILRARGALGRHIVEPSQKPCADAEAAADATEVTKGTEGSAAHAQEGEGGGESARVHAIHACDFLSDLIIRECMAEGVDFAVMPCCSKVRD